MNTIPAGWVHWWLGTEAMARRGSASRASCLPVREGGEVAVVWYAGLAGEE
jgi:hypothetical protein